MFGFLPYQSRWINDHSRLKIMEKSRQIGITYADAFDSVKKATSRSGNHVWVSSRDELTARLYLDHCKRWAHVLHEAAEDLGQIVIDQERDIKAHALRFASGWSIYSLSSNPDALVGKTGHIKLDEFAVHKNQRDLFRYAKPCTTWGGQVAIISTHRGADTVFNEMLTAIKEKGNPMGFSHHRVTIHDAVNQGLVEKINHVRGGYVATDLGPLTTDLRLPTADLHHSTEVGRNSDEPSAYPFPLRSGERVQGEVLPSSGGLQVATDLRLPTPDLAPSAALESRNQFLSRLRAECLDEEQWLQEYCCTPCDESSVFLTHDLLNAAEAFGCMKSFDYLQRCDNPLYAGVDVARKKHLCVIDVGEKIGDVIWDRYRIELQDRPFSEMEEELWRVLRLPKLQRACIDATGIGMQLAERAKYEFNWKAEPIHFTAPLKEELAFGLRMALEDRLLRIDPDPALRSDLRGIKKEVTSAGNIRFVAESEDDTGPHASGHCDRFWAKALRQHAAKQRREFWATVIE